jgi:16S rRNA processing protein RimM
LKRSQSMDDKGHMKTIQSGSLKISEPEFLVAGKLRKSHGLNGEMWIEVITDYPELFTQGINVFIGEKYKNIGVSSFRLAGKLGLIKFKGFENPESLASFHNAFLYFESKAMPELQDNEYYHHELIGVEVRDESGVVIGKLSEILMTGANDVYVITPIEGNTDILIPAIKSVIKKIDIESKLMIVNLPVWDK